jgi:hypothetical protein
MTFAEAYNLKCITCFAESPEIKFRIRGIENYGSGYQVLFECPECYTCFSDRYLNLGMTIHLISWLRKQGVIGGQPYRPRMASLDQWYYPWSDELKGYDFSEPKRFKRDQNNNWMVG